MSANIMPPTAQTGSRLLDLPAELRNRIYRLAIIEARIKIRASDPPPREPGLLSTCRQTRDEALQIWYKKNKFEFVIQDCDASRLIKWCEKSSNHAGSCVAVLIRGSPNWGDMKEWLRKMYEGRASGLMSGFNGCNTVLRNTVVKLTGIVYEMWKADSDSRSSDNWPEAEKRLEQIHQVMAALDPAWE